MISYYLVKSYGLQPVNLFLFDMFVLISLTNLFYFMFIFKIVNYVIDKETVTQLNSLYGKFCLDIENLLWGSSVLNKMLKLE